MSKKLDIQNRLLELGITFDENATTKELEALLPEDDESKAVKDETEDDNDGIVVTEPVNIQTDLPLVIKLPADASKAQIEFAKLLNAYAYQSPVNWKREKDDQLDAMTGKVIVKGLISKLKELKNAPDPVEQEGGLKYTNNRLAA